MNVINSRSEISTFLRWIRHAISCFAENQGQIEEKNDLIGINDHAKSRSTNAIYRPDIDGLRAIAVMMVVLFHAKLGFTGGFVGVDVFFVISGYLMTGLITRAQESQGFSLSDFFARRIRRIMPAATVAVLATLIIGCLVLFPQDLEKIGWATLAQQFMSANLYFFYSMKVTYFSPIADLNPLLHMWSLSVEEQFYIFFPIVMIASSKLGRFAVGGILLAVTIASFALGVYYTAPSTQTTSYFLLPCRAWEMLSGSLLFLFLDKSRPGITAATVLSIVGLCAILGSGVYYTSSTAFPGWKAIIPCVGAASVIYANSNPRNIVCRFLGCKPLVFLGLISFSLYLWHWPLIVFLDYLSSTSPRLRYRIMVVTVSVVVAFVSWRFVEEPVRRSSYFHSKRLVFILALVFTIITSGLGLAVALSRGIPVRFDAATRRVLETLHDSTTNIPDVIQDDIQADKVPLSVGKSGKIEVVLWGDSHAKSLFPAIVSACQDKGLSVALTAHNLTPPLLDFPPHPLGFGASSSYAQDVCKFIHRNDANIVIMSARWHVYTKEAKFTSSLYRTVESLVNEGRKVVLVQDWAMQEYDPRITLRKMLRNQTYPADLQSLGIEMKAHLDKQRIDRAVIENLPALFPTGMVAILDPIYFLPDSNGRWQVVDNGECIYADRDHLTFTGSLLLTPMFQSVIDPP